MDNISWDFFNPVKICFGQGKISLLKEYLLNKKCLVICSLRGSEKLKKEGIITTTSFGNFQDIFLVNNVNQYPDIKVFLRNFAKIKKNYFQYIIAFGGGSVIDTAKLASIFLSNKELTNNDFMKIITNNSFPFEIKCTPVICVPTTFGTGSEVTPFATIWDFESKKKYSIDNKKLFPVLSIIDPCLATDIPSEVKLSTSLDALNQSLESFWSKGSNTITSAYSLYAMKLAFQSIEEYINQDSPSKNICEDITQLSLLAGLAISHTRTAICHSISYPLTSYYNIPHGIACAFTMPSVLEYCLKFDDGRFLKLSNFIDKNNLDKNELLTKFKLLNQSLAITKKVKKYIPSYKNLLSLSNQMYTPKRADNLFCPISIKEIEKIIAKSWGE